MSSFAVKRHHIGELVKFGIVGGSGVVVNLAVYVAAHKILGHHPQDVFLPLRPTSFNIRWIHVFSTIAFVVANISNFELNRVWTFRSGNRTSRTRFVRFFTIGCMAQVVSLLILTALTHPHSPVQLPPSIFDGSSGFRTASYWAQVVAVIATTPVSFLLNRLWTFAGRHPKADAAPEPVAPPQDAAA